MDEQLVTFKHFRFVKGELMPYSRRHKHTSRNRPDGKGGMTMCAVKYPDGTQIIGIASCSREDNFCYSTGRLLSRMDADDQYIAMFQKRQEAQK